MAVGPSGTSLLAGVGTLTAATTVAFFRRKAAGAGRCFTAAYSAFTLKAILSARLCEWRDAAQAEGRQRARGDEGEAHEGDDDDDDEGEPREGEG